MAGDKEVDVEEKQKDQETESRFYHLVIIAISYSLLLSGTVLFTLACMVLVMYCCHVAHCYTNYAFYWILEITVTFQNVLHVINPSKRSHPSPNQFVIISLSLLWREFKRRSPDPHLVIIGRWICTCIMVHVCMGIMVVC